MAEDWARKGLGVGRLGLYKPSGQATVAVVGCQTSAVSCLFKYT